MRHPIIKIQVRAKELYTLLYPIYLIENVNLNSEDNIPNLFHNKNKRGITAISPGS